MRPSLHIKHARVWWKGVFHERDLFSTEVIQPKAAAESQIIDLQGHVILPALVNAHDHLELNHYPRTKFRVVYDNAHQWGEDVNMRLNDEPFRTLRAHPLKDRLFIGGLKNLLCGALRVAHHGPPHAPMFQRDFPVRVLPGYGWAHSLHFSTVEEIIRSYNETPKEALWFIHLAEGSDSTAESEYRRLDQMGCIDSKSVIVHGVGVAEADIKAASAQIRALVWCPSTNFYLLNRTAEVSRWSNVLLGSDSRLTADGDLLDEVRAAAKTSVVSAEALLNMMTDRAAALLKLEKYDLFQPGSHADWIAIPEAVFADFPTLRREDIALIVKGGVPQIGDPHIMSQFAGRPATRILLDGAEKAIHSSLARRILRCTLREPGLSFEEVPTRRFSLNKLFMRKIR